MATDVLIAGAGIIGLATALELAEHGLTVTVLERGEPMQEASWAAAGMLAVHDPENPATLQPFAKYSAALYPAFLARIEALTGLHVSFRTSETLQSSHEGANPYRFTEHSLDPRDLVATLPRACTAVGVRVLTRTEVTAIDDSAGTVAHTTKGVFTASAFVDCRGAWTPGVAPRKGQMLAVTLAAGTALHLTLRTAEIYIVPRGDGRVIVGATVEDAGFDKEVHPAAIRSLFEQAAALWPPLAEGRISESWAGLRPVTPDGLPILDCVAPNHYIAAGHYRNGILLAPGTARIMADLVLGHRPEIDLLAYRAARFNVQQENDNRLTAAL